MLILSRQELFEHFVLLYPLVEISGNNTAHQGPHRHKDIDMVHPLKLPATKLLLNFLSTDNLG